MLFCSLSLDLDSSEHLSVLYLFTAHGLILLCWRMLLPCRKQWDEIWRVGRLIIVFWKEISITKCERHNFISPIFRLHFTLPSDRDVCSVDLILLLPFHCLLSLFIHPDTHITLSIIRASNLSADDFCKCSFALKKRVVTLNALTAMSLLALGRHKTCVTSTIRTFMPCKLLRFRSTAKKM